jgi:AAA+ superfamily predicted ATPase
MKGLEELVFGIKAGYSFFYCQTEEVQKTTTDIAEGLKTYFSENRNGISYKVKLWDFEETTRSGDSTYNNPDEMFAFLENYDSGVDRVPVGTVVIAKNFNWFLLDEQGNADKTKTAWLLNRSSKFSDPEFRKILIVVEYEPFNGAIPEILRRDFAKIEFSLPGEKEIESIYDFIVNSAKGNSKFKEPDEKTKKRIISAARGLSNGEIIKVFSYSIVKGGGVFDPKTVEQLRAEEINATPGLTIGNYDKRLDDLKGYDVAKEIVDEWIDDPEAKGILLLGPAGVGKTHFCQALASHYNRLIIELEFAQLMGDGLVGQAEKAMKKALDVIAANANPAAPIIVFVDEIEKGLAGTSGAGGQGGANDGGTTDRSNAQFLKFLSDARPKGIYFVASCNDIERLPAAYVRAERWDTAPIFVDLPNAEEQNAILAHYQEVYGVVAVPRDMTGWSGAEIKAWCKLARKKVEKNKNASDADELIVPVSQTMSREIDYLRKWKEGKTVPASRKKVAPDKAERRVTRKLDM